MGIFDNLIHKTLSTISEVSGKISVSANNKIKKNIESSYSNLTIMYYKNYNVYKIYRAIFYNSSTNKSERVQYDLEFETVLEIEEFFKQYNLDCEYINALSKDYIYITKSGINTNGADFRLTKDIVSDLLFYSIYANSVLDSVDLVTDRVPLSKFYPVLENKDKLNTERWSYSTVENYLGNGRMVAFLMSQTNIEYDGNLDKIITNPKELLFDLVALGKSNQLHITHCGNLGIQISFK